MSVVRSWLRGLLSASGVTLLVPVGLLAAVAVAATVGGSGLGSVGQLVGGPEVPGGEQQAAARGGSQTLPTVPTRPSRARSRATTTASPAGTPAPTRRRSQTQTPQRKPTPTGTKPTTSKPVTTKTPTTSAPATPAPAPAAPAPAPAPTETNPVRQVGKAVQGVVAPLPIVGPAAADAVGTVIDLIAPPGP